MQFNDSHRKKLSTLDIARNRRISALNIAVLAVCCSIWLFACDAMGEGGGGLGTDEPAGTGGTTYTLNGSVKTSDNRADVLEDVLLRLRVKADGKNVKLTSPESNGKYVIPGIPNGVYTLKATHLDYETQTVDLTVTGNMTIPEILLVASPDSGPKYAVSGTVSLIGGAGNLTNAKVEIENLDTESGAIAGVNPAGAYTFNVPEGRYSVTASLDGYIPRSTGNVVVPQGVPGNVDVPDMALQAPEPTYTATGTVSLLDVSNNPVAIVPTSAAVLFTDNVTGLIMKAARPLPSGKYSVSGLSGGVYRVEAVLAGYDQATTVTQTIQADQTNINIQLKANGAPPPVYYTVSGRISTSDNNADISEAFAALMQGGGVKAVGVVQANGDYTISNVEADSGYNIKVLHPGYTQTAIADFDVSANVTGKNITLTQIIPPAYTVSGNVALASGSGNVANVTVSLKKVGSGTALTVSPSGTGDYSFTGVQAGDYTVKAALDGYHANETSSFTVNTNAMVPSLTLDEKKSPIAYTAVADGSSLVTSTKIDFVFSEAVTGLTAADITIGGSPGAATNGSLSGSGTAWSLALSAVSTAGAATVTIGKSGIESGARAITLFISPPDLSIKFSITSAGTTTIQDVTATFNAVHAYLATNPPVTGSGADTKIGGIALGDYIDLVSLTIGTDAPISNTELSGHGKLLRLIVVGINSFKVANNIGVVNSSAPTHLVFQFQNLPATHSMNSGDTNVGGYAASGMKAYIMGDFLTGLKSATGLTDAMLWAPARNVSHGGNPVTATDTITDALWLPTEWEMSGARTWSSQDYEVGVGQARLEYYQADADRKKYDSGNTASRYRLASPRPGNNMYFCAVRDNGATNMDNGASSDECVAPAFCIK